MCATTAAPGNATPAAKPTLVRTLRLGILVSLILLAGLWLMPTPAGLSVAGQRALAVTMFASVCIRPADWGLRWASTCASAVRCRRWRLRPRVWEQSAWRTMEGDWRLHERKILRELFRH